MTDQPAKATQREIDMFGCPKSEIDTLLKTALGGPAMVAVSILSDTQEMIERGLEEKARKSINVAKYMISSLIDKSTADAITTNHITNLTPVELADMEWPMSRELLLEAGMVLWEEIDALSRKYDDSQTTGTEIPPFVTALGEYRETLGTAQLRSDVMAFAEPLHIAWHIAYRLGNLAEAFDWEFTPWFVANCIDIDHKHGLSLKPDWKERARTHGANTANTGTS